MASSWNEIQKRIDVVANEMDADVYAYVGEITRDGATKFCDAVARGKNRKNCILMLATLGGDANAAYLIARRIQTVYKTKPVARYKTADDPQFICFVPWICKSAGTILAIGADRLIILDGAELGPVDAQLRKHDEVGERISGLTTTEALTTLQGRSKTAFIDFFRGLRFDPKLQFSTKMAAEIAEQLTVGLFRPVFEQLDPMRLAEMERTLRIAMEYGKRLDTGNLKDGGLLRLLSDYPSHGFIIDKVEMKEIFETVDDAPPALLAMAMDLKYAYTNHIDKEDPYAFLLSNPATPATAEPTAQTAGSDSNAQTPDVLRPDDGGDPGATTKVTNGSGSAAKRAPRRRSRGTGEQKPGG